MNDLKRTAIEVLRRNQGNPVISVEGFTNVVMGDAELLIELLGIKRATVIQAGLAYLEERAAELAADPTSPEPTNVASTVPVRAHKRQPPGTKIRTSAALAVAQSIYDREVGTGRRKIGDLTKFDLIQMKRRGLIDTTIADGLLGHDWPDEQKTRVRQIISEQDVRVCFDRAYHVLDAMGIARRPVVGDMDSLGITNVGAA